MYLCTYVSMYQPSLSIHLCINVSVYLTLPLYGAPTYLSLRWRSNWWTGCCC
ncbi:hypothetical protein B484DRAFT_459822 [Ochromonadaceae sp. CCMP2298]|nr:hypothetical protein B484DRAFT_459822 [Ochromonadaceae sp. CCMP2298]